MENRKMWVRVAGNSANIKDNNPYAWRCYLEADSKEIPIKNWVVSGIANSKNFIPGFNHKKDKNGLLAWVDCFGFVTVKEEILYIDLQD